MVRVVFMDWDKGVDCEYAYGKILGHLVKSRHPARCYDAVLLVQLGSGVRISDASRAFKQFSTTNSIELEVEASKKKRVECCKIVVPRELLSVALLGIEEKRIVSRLKVYSRYTYGFNTPTPLRFHNPPAPPGSKPEHNSKALTPRLHINLYTGEEGRGNTEEAGVAV
jgi:hypothetical protein